MGLLARYREEIDIGVGILICLCFGYLLYGAVTSGGHYIEHRGQGYPLYADFSHIDGLDQGARVKLAGVSVGRVDSQMIDTHNYNARVAFHIRPDIHLPRDTAAIITSDSLMSDKYISLFPGGDDQMIAPGGKITQTQGSMGIEQLLSKFITSLTQTLTQLQKNASAHGTAKNK